MCGFIQILDLGATNFQSSVQNVGALDLGVYQPATWRVFACEHCNHRLLTFSPPEQEHNWFGGLVSRGRWLTFEHLS